MNPKRHLKRHCVMPCHTGSTKNRPILPTTTNTSPPATPAKRVRYPHRHHHPIPPNHPYPAREIYKLQPSPPANAGLCPYISANGPNSTHPNANPTTHSDVTSAITVKDTLDFAARTRDEGTKTLPPKDTAKTNAAVVRTIWFFCFRCGQFGGYCASDGSQVRRAEDSMWVVTMARSDLVMGLLDGREVRDIDVLCVEALGEAVSGLCCAGRLEG
jgi:hypothetical protein